MGKLPMGKKRANYPWKLNGQITHGNSMGKLPMETQWANYPWVKCKMGKLPMETQWANYPLVKWANYPEWVNQRTKWVASIAKSLRLIIAKITMKSPEKDLTSPWTNNVGKNNAINHSWLGMVNIPIKMVQITLFFTHINGTIILISNTSNKKSNHIIHIVKLLTLLLLYTLILTVTDILTCSYYWLLLLVD